MSSFFQLEAEIAATCNALGCVDQKGEYQADVQVVESIKDLIRFLRRDEADHEVRRILGRCNVLVTDLLPILKKHWEQTELFDVLIRLLVNLTSPALLLYNEELPSDKATRNHFLQLIGFLQTYKQAFSDSTIWAVLSTRLSKILSIEWQERTEEMGIIIERILILVRNILQVPVDASDAAKRPDNDASIHDQVLWALHQSGMVDIFLYMATSENEQLYYMHILEITSLMLREQSPEALGSLEMNRSIAEKERDEAALLSVRVEENVQRQRKMKMYTGARHSRFGGTYVVKNMKSISDKDVIYHKPLNQLSKLNFDTEKNPNRKPKNKRPVNEVEIERRSALSIRLFLKEYCIEFLTGAYNSLMYNVKHRLAQASSHNTDETFYLWAMRFFMEFNRNYKFQVKFVSETMSVSTFHYVQKQIDAYQEMVTMDKKKFIVWSRRLHLALRAYRELLYTLMTMDKSPDESVRKSSHVIKSNVFYVIEYSEMVLHLTTTYDELKMSHSYLKDLLETQHIFLKMLEAFCRKDSLVIRQSVKPRKKKKKKASNKSKTVIEDWTEQWNEVSPEISAVLENDGAIPKEVAPFDAASDVPIEDQKSEAMFKIQRLIRGRKFEEGIALLRAAREVWPDVFGNANLSKEEEYSTIKEVFLANIQEENNIIQPVENEQENESEQESENEEEETVREADFNFTGFVQRFARPQVIAACGLALRNFTTNSEHTNHAICKLLYRIAFDCKMPTLLFQASLFRTFQRILNSGFNTQKLRDLKKFVIFVFRKFIEVAKTNPKVFMELLFWKSTSEAVDIEEGYGMSQQKSKASKRAWSELEEIELQRLFDEHSENNIEMDVVQWISLNLIDNTKSERAIKKKLMDLGLIGKKSSLVRTWNNDDEEELTELLQRFRDSEDVLENIVNHMSTDRTKVAIGKKLLAMGLIQDRSELKKKKRGTKKSGNIQHSDSDNHSSDTDPDESVHHGKKPTAKNKPRKTQKARPQLSKISNKQKIEELIKIVETDLKEVLNWLHESLNDAAEDQENDADDEGVPLVPITSEDHEALENDMFKNLLRTLGLVEPEQGQETYWRIPGNLTASQIRNLCSLIQQALDGTLKHSEEKEGENNIFNLRNSDSSSDEDIFTKMKAFMRKEDANAGTELNNEGIYPESEDILAQLETDSKASGKRNNNPQTASKPKGGKSRRIRLDSSDEEENMSRNSQVSELPDSNEGDSQFSSNLKVSKLKSKKNNRLSNVGDVSSQDVQTDNILSNSRVSKILDSDEDSPTPSNPKVKKGKSRLRQVESDDSENEETVVDKTNQNSAFDSLLEMEPTSNSQVITRLLESDSDEEEVEKNSSKRLRSVDGSDSGTPERKKTKRVKMLVSDDESD